MRVAAPDTDATHVMAPDRRTVMVMDLDVGGHHPGYARNFALAWQQQSLDANLRLLVTRKFFQMHPDVVASIQSLREAGISIDALAEDEEARLVRRSWLRYFYGWRLFCQYARHWNVDHGLIAYSDYFQLPMVVGQRSPCPFSMIYFRPTFHYHAFSSHRSGVREAFRSWRKKNLLRRVLRQPNLSVVYCLDEVVVDYIQSHMDPPCRVQRIADSFTQYASSAKRQAEIRRTLGIAPDRRVFLLLGVLDRRKGVVELLQSLDGLSADAARRICVLFVGPLSDALREAVVRRIQSLQEKLPIQILLQDGYVQDDQVQHYYDLADVVLVTYQRHMGSSLALIRAAHAGKPSLASDYGLLGQLVQRRRLGATVNTADTAALAGAIERFATVDLQTVFDAAQAEAFAHANRTEQLGRDLAAMLEVVPEHARSIT